MINYLVKFTVNNLLKYIAKITKMCYYKAIKETQKQKTRKGE